MNSPPITARTAAFLWFALSLFILYGSISDRSLDVERAIALPGISLPDIAQNLLLYLPFGTLGVLSLRRTGRSITATRIFVIGLAAAYSALMEWLQLSSISRIASPLDVVANVAGASAGALSTGLVERLAAKAIRALRPTGLFDAPARFALVILFALACAIAWYPFDVTLDVSTLSERTRAVRNDPWLPANATALVIQAVTYLILGGIATVSLPGLRKRAPIVAAVVTVGAAILIDLGQLAMGSEPIGLAALVSQAAGACAGAAAVFVAAGAGSAWYADA